MYQTNLFANSFRVIGWTKLFIWEMQPGNRLQKTLHGHVQRCFEVRNVQLASWSALWGDPKWTANQPPETVNGEKQNAKFLFKKETNWLYRSVSKKWCGWTLYTVKMFEFSYRSQEAGVASFLPENYNDIGESPRLMGDTCSNGCFFHCHSLVLRGFIFQDDVIYMFGIGNPDIWTSILPLLLGGRLSNV